LARRRAGQHRRIEIGRNDAALRGEPRGQRPRQRAGPGRRLQNSARPDFGDPAIAYCQGSPLRSEIEARNPSGLEAATAAAAAALARRFGEGPIAGRIKALVVAAMR
jgi:hypothetical protein